MNDRLKNAIEAYRNLDRTLKPVPFADARESALVEFLHALAAEHGKDIDFTRIDSRGEMAFNIVGPYGVGPNRPSGPYGEELAALLSQIHTRTGIQATKGHVLPENGWCHINHFEVEKLLHIVAERDLGAEPDEPDESGPRGPGM